MTDRLYSKYLWLIQTINTTGRSSANYEGAEHHFISFSLDENNKVERIMISTPPFDKISKRTFYNNIVFYDNCIDENFISVNDLIG